MLLESFQRPYRPLFTTYTFRPENYVHNTSVVLREIQLFHKRLRRRGHDLRYFVAIEAGDKKGRLHAHSVLWSNSLVKIPFWDREKYIRSVWQNGIVDCQEIKHKGGLSYVTKYITKNLANIDTMDSVDNYCRYTGMVKLPGRLYTWSNRPALGEEGIDRWRKLVIHHHKQKPYSTERLPPNYFNMFFIGKLVKAYIPSAHYKWLVQERLGIDLSHGKT